MGLFYHKSTIFSRKEGAKRKYCIKKGGIYNFLGGDFVSFMGK